ncbi:hypothetical protein pipiens_019986, partial [Culex pipiens pipiens]
MFTAGALGFCFLLANSAIGAEGDLSGELDFNGAPAIISSKIVKPAGAIQSCLETSYAGLVLFKFDNSKGFYAVCVQRHHLFGDGWVTVQQRVDGMGLFYKNWQNYREGFGSFDGSFWMGLEHVYQITSRTPHELIVELIDGDGEYSYARYSHFVIGDELEKYALVMLGNYSGNGGDYLSVYQGFGFSTFDDDNDTNGRKNCAVLLEAAWWYNAKCAERGCNLNGANFEDK